MLCQFPFFALAPTEVPGREVSIVAISETVLVLAGGTAVLSILFGVRVAMRAVAGGEAAVLEAIVPLPVPVAHSLARYVARATLAAGGFVIIAIGTPLFSAAGTNFSPTPPTTAPGGEGVYWGNPKPPFPGPAPLFLRPGGAP